MAWAGGWSLPHRIFSSALWLKTGLSDFAFGATQTVGACQLSLCATPSRPRATSSIPPTLSRWTGNGAGVPALAHGLNPFVSIFRCLVTRTPLYITPRRRRGVLHANCRAGTAYLALEAKPLMSHRTTFKQYGDFQLVKRWITPACWWNGESLTCPTCCGQEEPQNFRIGDMQYVKYCPYQSWLPGVALHPEAP